MNKVLLSGIVGVLLSGCGNNRGLSSQSNVFDIEYGFSQLAHDGYVDFVDSLKAVSLEVTEESLLGRHAYVEYADSNDIIIQSDDILYRFSSDGTFRNKIGIRGNGPFEHNCIYYTCVMPDCEKVYLYVGDNRMVVWSYSGKPVREFIVESEGMLTFTAMLDGKLIGETRDYSKDGSLKVMMKWFDSDGKLQKSIPLHEYTSMESDYRSVPITYMYDGKMIYKDTFDDVSYQCSADTIVPYYQYYMGKFGVGRDVLENMDLRNARADEFVEIVSLLEDDENLYALVVRNKELYGFVTDKKSFRYKFADKIEMPQRGGGMSVVGLSSLKLWPTYADKENNKYSLVNITDEDTVKLQNIRSNFIPFTSAPNPVLLRYK